MYWKDVLPGDMLISYAGGYTGLVIAKSEAAWIDLLVTRYRVDAFFPHRRFIKFLVGMQLEIPQNLYTIVR